MSSAERHLAWFLRAYAASVLLALVAAMLPFHSMAAIHAWLGLGEMPYAPIVEYLARTTSTLYAYHGAIVLILSFDVRRYRPLIAFHGWMNFLATPFVLASELAVGLPAWWAISEAAAVAVTGGLMLVLLRRCPKATLTSP